MREALCRGPPGSSAACGNESGVTPMASQGRRGCALHGRRLRPRTSSTTSSDLNAPRLPARGAIGNFNGFHCEEVLLVRVHDEVLDR